MRSTKVMHKLILDIAMSDEDILAVYINGSRANVNAPVDIFQDYDIVYVVRDTTKYILNEDLPKKFGEILYMQCPPMLDLSIDCDVNITDSYNWLLQLSDGNRVDLSILQLDYAKEQILKDKICIVLLDKGGYLPPIPPSSDEDYHVKPFTYAQYNFCCNEFWWCLNNVGKSLKRGEVLYTADMINFNVRTQLIQMLTWYAGILSGFSKSMGKSSKYIKDYLPREMYDKLLLTYSDCDVSNMWESADIMCKLFFDVSELVARKMDYTFNAKEANASYQFFCDVRTLPHNATEIYK